MKEFRYIGSHAEHLDGPDGMAVPVAPGDYTGPIEVDPEKAPRNAQLLDEGLLVEGSPPQEQEVTLKDLQKQAKELNIEGSSSMNKEQLTNAIAEARQQEVVQNQTSEEGQG